MTTFEITTSPVAALVNAALVVGTGRTEDGDLKLYLGARYRNVYVVVPASERADEIERGYHGAGPHVWLKPAPAEHFLCVDEEEATG